MTTVNDKRVYVPNKGQHDYTDAWNFGELIFCTEGTINRKDLLTMHAELDNAMLDARNDDYILLTGLTSICVVACAIFASRFGRINLLIHDDGHYLERSLNFDGSN